MEAHGNHLVAACPRYRAACGRNGGQLRGAAIFAESIANTAAAVAGFYAPNTFVSIYGVNLADATRAISPDDITAGALPTVLPEQGFAC